ncbi:MAG: hypothetical protein K2X43_04715 [Hyphomonadaceae bacterium]|nr:hypothetical protein [Hyphomonadaceae bacterium]
MSNATKSTGENGRLGARLALLGRHASRAGRAAVRRASLGLRAFWDFARPLLRALLQIALALLILLEEWGWRPLAELLGRLARWRPWAQVETAIARLPPYAALVVFVVPSALLLPLKFLALFLIAKGQLLLAGLLFAGAKVVATALVARLFMLTQPALMQIGWFAWAYDTIMPWKEALVERVRASWVWRAGRVWKERVKRTVSAQWRAWRPAMLRLRATLAAATGRLRRQGRRLIANIRGRRAASQR